MSDKSESKEVKKTEQQIQYDETNVPTTGDIVQLKPGAKCYLDPSNTKSEINYLEGYYSIIYNIRHDPEMKTPTFYEMILFLHKDESKIQCTGQCWIEGKYLKLIKRQAGQSEIKTMTRDLLKQLGI